MFSASCEDVAVDIVSTKDDASAAINVKSKDEQSSSKTRFSHISDCRKDMKGTFPKPIYFVLNNGLVFSDKLLPHPACSLVPEITNFSPQ